MFHSEFQGLKIASHTESQLILFTTTLGLGFYVKTTLSQCGSDIAQNPVTIPTKLPRLLGVVWNRLPLGIFQDSRTHASLMVRIT